jgi:hypothetical protein
MDTAMGVPAPTDKLGTRIKPPPPAPPFLLFGELPPPPPPPAPATNTPAFDVVGLDVKVPLLVNLVINSEIGSLLTPMTPPFPLGIVVLPL